MWVSQRSGQVVFNDLNHFRARQEGTHLIFILLSGTCFQPFFLFHFLPVTFQVILFSVSSDAMRLILVKPTNATRRLDLTGEVYRDGDLEHSASGDPSTLTKSPEKKQHASITSVDALVCAQEASLCCESPPTHDRPNGISPPKVAAQMMPRNLTLSQLSDQDWLLLCGQVSSIEDDSPSPGSRISCVQHPNHSDACGCSCLDAHQQAKASCIGTPKHSTRQDYHSRVPKRRSLSSSTHVRTFPQRTQAANACQELAHHQGLSKPTANQAADCFKFKETEGQKGSLPQCNRAKLQENVPSATLFNIPFNSTECAQTTRELLQHSQSVDMDFRWRELFGKQPLLVQQRQKPHCSVGGEPSSESSGDPSVVLNCRHLPYDHSASTQEKLLPIADDKNEQPFSISRCGSLENQDLVVEEDRQRPDKVTHQITLQICEVTPLA